MSDENPTTHRDRDATTTLRDPPPTESDAPSSDTWDLLVPRTTVGKLLLGVYVLALLAVALPLLGVAYDQPRLLGPFPEAVTWTYAWYGVMNAVLLGTYALLLGPWADHAEQYVETMNDERRGSAAAERER